MWNTKYEVHWISPDGNDCLLAGSNNLEDANEMAIEQARHIFENPWETNERKVKFLDSIYICDTKTDDGRDYLSYYAEEQIEMLMFEIDSRIQKVS